MSILLSILGLNILWLAILRLPIVLGLTVLLLTIWLLAILGLPVLRLSVLRLSILWLSSVLIMLRLIILSGISLDPAQRFSRSKSLKKREQFWFRDGSISLKINACSYLFGFLLCEPPGIIELYEKLIQEGMQFADV